MTVNSRRHRVLVGCFSVECNSFAPGATTIDDFRLQTFVAGSQLNRLVLGPSSELAVAWQALEDAGCEIVPSVAAWSSAHPPLDPEVVRELVQLSVDACDDHIDGAYFALHGGSVAHDDDDPEGTLLSALRWRLGPDVPIVVSLDCHANLTPLMVSAVNAITAYRTVPHTDLPRTAEQAARILVTALDGRARPVCCLAGRPMITPADLHDTDRDPLRRLMELCDQAERDGVLAAALLPVTPWLDLPGVGWKAVVTTDGDVAGGRAIAERIIEQAWRSRGEFLAGRRPPIDEALAEALRGPAPYVLADSGDSPNGGSLGDSTELLRAALRLDGSGTILLSILDASAADAAHRAGAGVTLETALGAGPSGAYNERTSVTARVIRLFDGEIHYTHPFSRGYRATIGPSALLDIGSIQVVVHSRIINTIDPAVYYALGADPSAVAVVQAKSHISYRAGFQVITPRSIVAGTPGPTNGDLRSLPYRRRPRPLYPFEDP